MYTESGFTNPRDSVISLPEQVEEGDLSGKPAEPGLPGRMIIKEK